jgi:hypothetical protein
MRICQSCGGRYAPVGRDGIRYFHRCPPVTRATVRRGGAVLVVDLDQVREIDTRLEDVVVDRADGRDENVRVDPVDGKAKPKAEGKGAVDV